MNVPPALKHRVSPVPMLNLMPIPKEILVTKHYCYSNESQGDHFFGARPSKRSSRPPVSIKVSWHPFVHLLSPCLDVIWARWGPLCVLSPQSFPLPRPKEMCGSQHASVGTVPLYSNGHPPSQSPLDATRWSFSVQPPKKGVTHTQQETAPGKTI